MAKREKPPMVTPSDAFLLTKSAYQLIEELDRLYPHRCIARGETLEDAHRYSGARALIDELLSMMEEEKETKAGHE